MAQTQTTGPLPCLFCGKLHRNAGSLTQHLDIAHQGWVQHVLDRVGLNSPPEYPIEEYRRAVAQAFACDLATASAGD